MGGIGGAAGGGHEVTLGKKKGFFQLDFQQEKQVDYQQDPSLKRFLPALEHEVTLGMKKVLS